MGIKGESREPLLLHHMAGLLLPTASFPSGGFRWEDSITAAQG